MPSSRSQMQSVTAHCAICMSRNATVGRYRENRPPAPAVGTISRHVTRVLSFDKRDWPSHGHLPCAPGRFVLRSGGGGGVIGMVRCAVVLGVLTSKHHGVCSNQGSGTSMAGGQEWEPATTYG